MINLENLENLYFLNEEPVPYTLKCGVTIMIHPILVKNWNEFSYGINCLTIRKNEINNVEIIQMKYLDFLLMLMTQQEDVLGQLMIVLKHSLNAEFMSVEELENGKFYIAITNKDGEILYGITSKDFDDIKSIILHQNIYDYDDRYISPEVRILYEQYLEAIRSNQTDPSLERKKIFVMGKTGFGMKELNNMSYRTFSQLYITNVNVDLYFAKKIIQSSSKYDVKEEPIYPLFEKDKDKYEGLFLDKNTIQQKLDKIQ